MGSFKVPKAIEKRVALWADGRTLGPYFRNRSRASESANPVHGLDWGSTVDACATSASDGHNRALCLSDHTMCKCPGNVGRGAAQLATTANTHDDCIGSGSAGEIRNSLDRGSEYDADLRRVFADVAVRTCFESLLRLLPRSVSLSWELHLTRNGPDYPDSPESIWKWIYSMDGSDSACATRPGQRKRHRPC